MQGVSLCCSDAELESQLRFLGFVVEELEILEADVLELAAGLRMEHQGGRFTIVVC